MYANARYTGADKRSERRNLDWKIAGKRGRINALPAAKVEHWCRVIKGQFEFTKVRFKGLAKNTAKRIYERLNIGTTVIGHRNQVVSSVRNEYRAR